MSKERYNQIIDEAYAKYSEAVEKDNSVGLNLLVKIVDGSTKYRKPDRGMFEVLIRRDKTFSERWGLKVEERELSLQERHQLVRVNGLCPKYSFEIEDGKPIPNKLSEDEWYNKYNVPTKLITVTYNNETIEVYV